MKFMIILMVFLAGVAIGWFANRSHCNIQAYWIGFEAGQHDGMSSAMAAIESGQDN